MNVPALNRHDELFFGIPLSTHRVMDSTENDPSYFYYESLIAAIAIFSFRSRVRFSSKKEPLALTLFCAATLALLAFFKKPYQLIFSVEVFSYLLPWILEKDSITSLVMQQTKGSGLPSNELFFQAVLIGAGAAFANLICQLAATNVSSLVFKFAPSFLYDLCAAILPVTEMMAAYNIMSEFAHPDVLQRQLYHLLFVTFHIQVAIGYIGIGFLRSEQSRRNELVRMDKGEDKKDREEATKVRKERAKRFHQGALPFILFSAFPYMLQIIFYGNVNKFAFTCLQHDMHRTIRLHELFENDNHLTAMASETATTPAAYATSMDAVVMTTYDLINRKLFSLPKVLLLPAVLSNAPQLVYQLFPIIFVTDWLKGRAISYMTTKIESLQKEVQDLRAKQNKIEAYDMKNGELLLRSGKGAMQFTEKQWEDMTVQIQGKVCVSDLITRTKQFFNWLQRNFVFSVIVDCALASLIATFDISSADTFVYSRAIEDSVDMILMKSRAEAELARMMTEIDRLSELSDIWKRSNSRNLMHCNVATVGEEDKGVTIRNLHYSRGTAEVRADHVEIPPGIYALTGANGSGKSTLFRVLMSCETNKHSIDLPSSIHLHTPRETLIEEDDLIREISCEQADQAEEEDEKGFNESTASECVSDISTTQESNNDEVVHIPRPSIWMPSSDVVEISQNFYWPLYTKPIDWIFQTHLADVIDDDQLQLKAQQVAEELQSMVFFQTQSSDESADNGEIAADKDDLQVVVKELLEEKEDWFSDLSGGQKSKVELVRQVFLAEECPKVLLIDETMAPLDPTSKSLVMRKLKDFCSESVVIVIYHADVGHEQEAGEGSAIECVPSNNFFDANIHLENKLINIRPVCA